MSGRVLSVAKEVASRAWWGLVLVPCLFGVAMLMGLSLAYPWPESFILWCGLLACVLIGMRALKGLLAPHR